ncbi:cellulose binding domain-containing protein [Leeuwenhoekiella parthenopeia]|uniref:T9SS type A sorting domain-containing protein n=1 Tax=Leeuwenhoekiella parthenopeia TaxID=2890320 RepID=A0ABS8GMS2_9FLAO|nr:cellulose binding domain-containing protein [Leeuwenhoekiella parthenopeia]MCC4211277.1 T9SS type A sorting domain-containing protein [Leeuwenhoekiella parthenopeia]
MLKNYQIFIFVLLMSFSALGQITTYQWPKEQGQALISDKYEVYVKSGSSEEVKLEVLMSHSRFQGDFRANELEGRTFSFVNIDYNPENGESLTFRVVKLFGDNSQSIELVPKSYNLQPSIDSGNEVSFDINESSKYISVNFNGLDNQTPTYGWIKHMLCIFINPGQNEIPESSSADAVIYSNSVPSETLKEAGLIYFPKGYHNLRNYTGGDVISDDGVLYLQDGQSVYFEGGAFVEGLIDRNPEGANNQKIFGRGILSGRQYEWRASPLFEGPFHPEILRVGNNASIEGITVLDSPHHGIVGNDNVTIKNVKFNGWHANNDGIRVSSGSEISETFVRAVDDHFYNWNIYVHDCVLWAGHNGAIMTYGWSNLRTGASLMENIDVINPEWTGLGNNNGLIASQVALDFSPRDYGTGSTLTTLRNIRIEGSIPGITNLKPRSETNAIPSGPKVLEVQLGYLGDLLLDNIQVENQFNKGRIIGRQDATSDGSSSFLVKNVTLTNVEIGGVKLNEDNANIFFDIEETTTKDIVFDPGQGKPIALTRVETFDEVSILPVTNSSGAEYSLNQNNLNDLQAGEGNWFGVQATGNTDYNIYNEGGNPDAYLGRSSDVAFARGVAYVYNNSDLELNGLLSMSFDYFWKLDGNRLSYRVYGINDNEANGIDGRLVLTGGSGAFGDNFACEYKGSDATELSSNLALGTSSGWSKYDYDILLSDYEYIIIAFANTYGSVQSGNIGGLFGIDNVTVPFLIKAPIFDLQANRSGINQVNLNWINLNESITKINVLRKADDAEEFTIIDEIDATSIYIDSNADPAKSYTYKLEAFNETQSLGFSSEVSITPRSLAIYYKNSDAKPMNNQIEPHFELKNIGGTTEQLSDYSFRYWFKTENYDDLNSVIDYAALDKSNIKTSIQQVSNPRIGATHYLQVEFSDDLESLSAGEGTGIIQSRIHKKNWTNFDETNDFSYQASAPAFKSSESISIYKNGELIWGMEPKSEEPNLQISVNHKVTKGNRIDDGQIKPSFDIINEGNTALDLKELEVRYWFSSEENDKFNFYTDYAKLGTSNIQGQIIDLQELSTPETTHYLSLKFADASGKLAPFSSTGEIQTRFNGLDYSKFDESNDWSFSPSTDFILNDRITVYYKGNQIFGSEPSLNRTIVFLNDYNDSCGALGPRIIPTLTIASDFDEVLVYRNQQLINVVLTPADGQVFGRYGRYRFADVPLEPNTTYEYRLELFSDGKLIGNGIFEATTAVSCETKAASNEKITLSKEATNNNSFTTVSLYPNPFKDLLNVSFSKDESPEYLIISDMSGKQVFYKKLTADTMSLQLQISGFSKGIYLLTVYNKAGNQKTFKLIKE